jgi:hypothetical protein
VLIVMPDQGRRALLRAALRDTGYDALGAPDFAEALSYPATERGRGPVRLVILDQAVLLDGDDAPLTRLLNRFGEPTTLLLSSAMAPRPESSFGRVIQRPTSIAHITRAVQHLLALPAATAHPMD